MEIPMRILALSALALGTVLSSPAGAQTFAPGFPVCLHVYGRVSYYECSFTSLPQCNASASGRAAQCIINPYWASANTVGPALRYRRRPPVY
jgi:hypothetical protein